MSLQETKQEIISLEDFELIEHLEDEEDVLDARQALEEYKKTGEAYSWEEVKKELRLSLNLLCFQ